MRIRPRFRLKTLLSGCLLIGVALGWIGGRMERARQQKAAVSALWKLHWLVRYDHLEANSFLMENGEDELATYVRRPPPQWLYDLCGVDFLATVIEVKCAADFVEEDLQAYDYLARLPRLRKVQGRGVRRATANWPSWLARRLEILGLEDTMITDEACAA